MKKKDNIIIFFFIICSAKLLVASEASFNRIIKEYTRHQDGYIDFIYYI